MVEDNKIFTQDSKKGKKLWSLTSPKASTNIYDQLQIISYPIFRNVFIILQ